MIPGGGGGGGHFHSKVISMLVIFFRVQNSDFGIFRVFWKIVGKLLENGSHFCQNSPQDNPKKCNIMGVIHTQLLHAKLLRLFHPPDLSLIHVNDWVVYLKLNFSIKFNITCLMRPS